MTGFPADRPGIPPLYMRYGFHMPKQEHNHGAGTLPEQGTEKCRPRYALLPTKKGGHQMDYNQNTNPTEQQQFLLPAMTMDSDFTAEELAEDMEGMQMNFPRVKIPS